jgi:hypothetical protein
MQFEQDPYPDDETAADDLELALSPKLASLGDRLSADADSIAARYPIEASPAFGAEFWGRAQEAMDGAGSNQPQPVLVGGRLRRLVLIASSAAAACVLLAAIVTWRLSDLKDDASGENLTAAVGQSDNGSGSGAVANGDLHPAQGSINEERVLRVNILKGLSGAEQEAVLDLLDRQSPPPSSVSI